MVIINFDLRKKRKTEVNELFLSNNKTVGQSYGPERACRQRLQKDGVFWKSN